MRTCCVQDARWTVELIYTAQYLAQSELSVMVSAATTTIFIIVTMTVIICKSSTLLNLYLDPLSLCMSEETGPKRLMACLKTQVSLLLPQAMERQGSDFRDWRQESAVLCVYSDSTDSFLTGSVIISTSYFQTTVPPKVC